MTQKTAQISTHLSKNTDFQVYFTTTNRFCKCFFGVYFPKCQQFVGVRIALLNKMTLDKQIFLGHLTLKFVIRTTHESHPANIYCIFTLDGKIYRISTGMKVFSKLS